MSKLVEVTWEDTASSSGWQRFTPGEHQPMICRSVGYLLEGNDVRGRPLVLAQSISDEDGVVADILTIPYKAMQNVTYLA